MPLGSSDPSGAAGPAPEGDGVQPPLRPPDGVPAHGTPGILILLVNARATSKPVQKLIAVTTQGPFHVEAAFAVRTRAGRSDGEGFWYTLLWPLRRYTAHIGRPFGAIPMRETFFQDREKWTVCFAPVASMHDLERARAWAVQHEGAGYNFSSALVAPFMPARKVGRASGWTTDSMGRLGAPSRDDPGKRRSGTAVQGGAPPLTDGLGVQHAKFCSQAVVRMLQIAGAADGAFDGIEPSCITPAGLLRHLDSVGPRIDRVDLSRVVMVPQGEEPGDDELDAGAQATSRDPVQCCALGVANRWHWAAGAKAGLDGPALVRYVDANTFVSNAPKDRMVADADSKGHSELLAKDASAHSASKAFFSLPSVGHLLRYLRQLPCGGRHLYELLRDTEPVRLWLDVEFLSDSVGDGEAVRERVHALLEAAVRASFGVADPIIFWGTSSRRDGAVFKHSYQARVPSVIFPNNATHGPLKRWVDAFAELTKEEPLLRCPKSGKHVVDTAVYTKNRLVRTCFSSKRKDSTSTPLRLMRNVGAAPRLFAGDLAMPDAQAPEDGGMPCLDEALVELHALMVRPLVHYDFARPVTHVSDMRQPLRCKGVGVVGDGDDGGGDVDMGLDCGGGGPRGAKRPRHEASDRRGRARSRRGARVEDEEDAALADRSEAVVQALALLGPRRCESYDDWQNVLFACKNSSASAPPPARQRVLSAFVEWSKRASSFVGDKDVVQQFEGTPARTAGRVYTATSLQRWAAEDPCLVFAGVLDGVVYDGEGKVMLFPDWTTFFSCLDKARTDWRTLVRVARHLYPGDEQSVIADVVTHMGRTAAMGVRREAVVQVWNYPWVVSQGSDLASGGPAGAGGAGDAFGEHLRTFVRQRLSMPSLARCTLPAALVSDEQAARALQGAHTADEDALIQDGLYTYECVQYTPLETGKVKFVMQRRLDDGVLLDERLEFVLRVADGTVSGTTLNLRKAGWMFRSDCPGRLHAEYGLDTQLGWAAMIGQIPAVQENILSVKQGPWLVYDGASELWEELEPRDVKLRVYIADIVREYLEPLRSLLLFSVVVLDNRVEADVSQLDVLDKILARFSNSAFLDNILDALQGVPGVRIPKFNALFNLDPYLLPCRNGMLDFRTLELVPLRKEHYYTWRAPVSWNPDADMTGPRSFVASLFPDDTENVVKYILEWFGYCLSGLTNMQTLTFMIGYGSNGKSKLTRVLENILGKTGFAHVSYEALCQRSTGPNEELFAGRHARLWQVDENDGDHTLNLAMLKKITGEDTIKCRQMYGHIVTVPARAKLNFAVNKPPKLPAAADLREQSSLWRRFVYVNCPMQFVDMTPGSKDAEKIELLKDDMRADRYAVCVKQVDINLDARLDQMTEGFLLLFATSLHSLIRADEHGVRTFRPISTPSSIQKNIARMMRANPALRADPWLTGNYDVGVSRDAPLKSMYADFLAHNDMDETNFPLSRFEADVDRWMAFCNSSEPNCRQLPLLKQVPPSARQPDAVGGAAGGAARAARLRSQTIIKNCHQKAT